MASPFRTCCARRPLVPPRLSSRSAEDEGGGKCEAYGIELDFIAARQLVEVERSDGTRAPPGECNAERATDHREYSGFGEQLSCEASHLAADRVTRGQLARSAGRSHDHQIREIDASDHEHEQDAAPQQIQRTLDVAYQIVLQQHGDGTEVRVFENLFELRHALVDGAVQRINLLLHQRNGDAISHAADHLPVVAVTPVVAAIGGRKCGGCEQVDVIL